MGVGVERAGGLEERLHHPRWNNSDVRNIVGVRGSPQAGVVGMDPVLVSIELNEKPLHQKHHDTAVLHAHPWLLTELPMVQLPLPLRITERKLPVGLLAHWL